MGTISVEVMTWKNILRKNNPARQIDLINESVRGGTRSLPTVLIGTCGKLKGGAGGW